MSCTLFVLAACVANIVVLEFGEWWLLYNEDLQYVIVLHQMEELAFYGTFFLATSRNGLFRFRVHSLTYKRLYMWIGVLTTETSQADLVFHLPRVPRARFKILCLFLAGHIIPSLTTCAVIALAFLDAQFLYCTSNLRKTPRMRHIHINETVSDIEYIIPRVSKTNSLLILIFFWAVINYFHALFTLKLFFHWISILFFIVFSVLFSLYNFLW